MELTEIAGMAVGDRKSLRANGRYKAGQVLHDDSPYIDEVLRVVEVSGPPIFWDRDRIDDEDDLYRRPGDVTTDITVERIERSHNGQAIVSAFWERYREPVKVVAGELRANACEEQGSGFFRDSGEVRPLAKDRFHRHSALAPIRSESISGFGAGQQDRVYALPADGWYEASAMGSPSTCGRYFFRLVGGRVAELAETNSLDSRYGLHWTQLYEAETRFRNEHGVHGV